jgi:hypothetical protein
MFLSELLSELPSHTIFLPNPYGILRGSLLLPYSTSDSFFVWGGCEVGHMRGAYQMDTTVAQLADAVLFYFHPKGAGPDNRYHFKNMLASAMVSDLAVNLGRGQSGGV